MFILFIILAAGIGLYSLLAPPVEQTAEPTTTDDLLQEQLIISSIRLSERSDP